MRPTLRFWRVTALALFLSVLSVVLDDPRFLFGTVGLGVYLLAGAVRFFTALRTVSGATVTQRTSRDRVVVDQPTVLTLSVSLPTAVPVDVAVAPRLPPSARSGDTPTVELLPNEVQQSESAPIRSSVAGNLSFDTPEATVRSEGGLFTETLSLGDPHEVTVEPRGPRRLHVGQGGSRLSGEYGEHGVGSQNGGIHPVKLRLYVAGDDLARIDWKATARLGKTHVREHEVESSRRTGLFVDRRASMADGPPGESKLAYLREVALRFVDSAAEYGDAISYHTVEDGGTGRWTELASNTEQYLSIRRQLEGLEPPARPPQGSDSDTSTDAYPTHTVDAPSAGARALARDLEGDDSRLARTLRPYFERTESYVTRLEGRPLFGAIDRYLRKAGGARWLVLFTDDTERGELHEAVKLASRQDRTVLVFLAPTVLFERGVTDDLEDAYREYRDFEEFRKSLNRLEDVSAFEVGPGDRLDAVLESNKARRRRRTGRNGGSGEEVSETNDSDGAHTEGASPYPEATRPRPTEHSATEDQ